MSTRSTIGRLLPNGLVQYVYCHCDGYPTYNGRILLTHYDTPTAVAALIVLGDLGVLGEVIGEAHDFDKPPKGVCNYYGRDRGEKGVEPRTAVSVQGYVNGAKRCDADYQYLFDEKAGLWLYRRVYGGFGIDSTFGVLTAGVCGIMPTAAVRSETPTV